MLRASDLAVYPSKNVAVYLGTVYLVEHFVSAALIVFVI